MKHLLILVDRNVVRRYCTYEIVRLGSIYLGLCGLEGITIPLNSTGNLYIITVDDFVNQNFANQITTGTTTNVVRISTIIK